MPDSNTGNYNFILPEVGGSDDTWGTKLNQNWSDIDVLLKNLQDQITANADDLEAALQNKLFPVGSLYTSTLATNPFVLLGFGTWVPYAEGRALVGVGTADSIVWAAGDLKGSASVVLSAANLPAHSHSSGSLTTANDGSHSHGSGSITATADGNHNHGGNTGNDGQHNHQVVSHDSTNNQLIDTTNNAGSGRDRVYGSGGALSVLSDPNNEDWWTDGAANKNFGAAHNHSISNSGTHTHSTSGSTAAAGTHNHSISGSTGSVGSGTAVSLLQPSVAVHVWQRTV